jgi:hypothetical protein
MARPVLPLAYRESPRPVRARAFERLRGGGPDGNERLTSATGAVLIVLLALIGVTILRIGSLLWLHLFVGLVLVPPVLLKMASTGYRFVRYYTSDPVYRRKGPPMLALRLIAPAVVLSTVAVFASGVVLLFAGPAARATYFPIHKIGFFVWVGFTAVHVLGHLPGLPAALRGDYATPAGLPGYRPGRAGRIVSLACAIVLGLVLAILLIGEFGVWLHAHGVFHHHR